MSLPEADSGGDSVADAATQASSRSGRAALPELIGTLVAGRYRVLDLIGVGGMGKVYLAEHVKIRKKFALKVLAHNFVTNNEFVDRFLQEARAASAVSHPNVIEITDFGETDDGMPFFVMEYLEGEELNSIIKREGAQPWPRVRGLMLQLLAALDAAHRQGVVHRDVKPHNCLLVDTPEGRDFLKVLDFGIAKVFTDDVDYRTLTPMGAVLGTAQYMSPEQARSEPVDERADVYSAGVIAFELLTGKVPYRARGLMGVVSKLLTEELPTISDTNPDVQVAAVVEGVLRKAMAKERDDRYASAAEFASALREIDSHLDAALGLPHSAPSSPSQRSVPVLSAPPSASHARVLWVRPPWLTPTLAVGVIALLVAAIILLLAARQRERSIAAIDRAGQEPGSMNQEAKVEEPPLVVPAAPIKAEPREPQPQPPPPEDGEAEGGEEPDEQGSRKPGGSSRKPGGGAKKQEPKPAVDEQVKLTIDVRKPCELQIDGDRVGCALGQSLRLTPGEHQLRWRFPSSASASWLTRKLQVSEGSRCLLLFSDDFQLTNKACSG